MNPTLECVTERIHRRSKDARSRCLQRIEWARDASPARRPLPCSNLAHGMAACGAGEKEALGRDSTPNIGAPLAAERDQVLMRAAVALDAQEPMLQQPARQVVLELLADKPR